LKQPGLLNVADVRSKGARFALKPPIRIRNRIAEIDRLAWSPGGNALALEASIRIGPLKDGAFSSEIVVVRDGVVSRTLMRGRSSAFYPYGLGLSQWERTA